MLLMFLCVDVDDLLSMLLLMLLSVMFMLYRSPNALGPHPVLAIVPRQF